MQATIFRAEFEGMRIKVLQQKGNPCRQPEFQEHFHVGYKLVCLEATPENKNVGAGYWNFKLVQVKPSWDRKFQDQCPLKMFHTIEQDEIVTHADYRVGMYYGKRADMVTLTIYSLRTGNKQQIIAAVEHLSMSQLRK